MSNWTGFDVEGAVYVGTLELETHTDPVEHFELSIVRTETHFVAGGVCNTGLLQSCAYEIDPIFSDDENLQEFYDDIMVAINNGPELTTDAFTCNTRLAE